MYELYQFSYENLVCTRGFGGKDYKGGLCEKLWSFLHAQCFSIMDLPLSKANLITDSGSNSGITELK